MLFIFLKKFKDRNLFKLNILGDAKLLILEKDRRRNWGLCAFQILPNIQLCITFSF